MKTDFSEEPAASVFMLENLKGLKTEEACSSEKIVIMYRIYEYSVTFQKTTVLGGVKLLF
jgi:hypothetical protein